MSDDTGPVSLTALRLHEGMEAVVAELRAAWLGHLNAAAMVLVGNHDPAEAMEIIHRRGLRSVKVCGDMMREQLWEGDRLRYEQWIEHDPGAHVMTIRSEWQPLEVDDGQG